jgi:hypothetical protein
MSERNTIIGIAIFIFAALTAVLGGIAFYYKLEGEQLQKRITITTELTGKTKLAIDEPTTGVTKQINDVAEDIKKVKILIDDPNDGLVAKTRDIKGLISDNYKARDEAHTAWKSAETQRRSGIDSAIKDLGVQYRDLVESLNKLEEGLKGQQDELKKEQDNLLNVMASEHGKTDKLREEIMAIKAEADKLRLKLERMRERQQRLEQLHKDGVVLSADPATNTAVVGLGRNDGVRPGMIFDVFEIKRSGEYVRKAKARLRRVEAQQSFAMLLEAREIPKFCPQCGWWTTDVTHMFCPYCLGGEDDREKEAQRLNEGSSKDRVITPEFLNPVAPGDYFSSPFYLGRLKKQSFTFAVIGQTVSRSRQEIRMFLRENNCTLMTDITLDTDFAVVGVGPNIWKEVEDARNMGVSVIRESELFDFFGRAGSSSDELPVLDRH